MFLKQVYLCVRSGLMDLISAYHSEKGKNRPTNQDGLLIKTASSLKGKIGLFVVCDGMGGLNKGELASATVIRGLSNWFANQLPNHIQHQRSSDDIWLSFEKRVQELNRDIVQYGDSKNIQLGTTLTALFLFESSFYIAQVGDSRAYHFSNGVEQVTEDQSLVAREVTRGVLTSEEARTHPKRHVLLQCIGVQDEIELVVKKGPLKTNDGFLLCTDGFYQQITNEELRLYFVDQTIHSRELGAESLRQLAKRTVQRGETDDLSAIYLKIM